MQKKILIVELETISAALGRVNHGQLPVNLRANIYILHAGKQLLKHTQSLTMGNWVSPIHQYRHTFECRLASGGHVPLPQKHILFSSTSFIHRHRGTRSGMRSIFILMAPALTLTLLQKHKSWTLLPLLKNDYSSNHILKYNYLIWVMFCPKTWSITSQGK